MDSSAHSRKPQIIDGQTAEQSKESVCPSEHSLSINGFSFLLVWKTGFSSDTAAATAVEGNMETSHGVEIPSSES